MDEDTEESTDVNLQANPILGDRTLEEWAGLTLPNLVSLRETADLMTKELECPICLSGYVNARQLSCGHVYCQSCVLEMLNRKSRCAVCGTAVTKRCIRTPQLDYDSLVKNIEIVNEELAKLGICDEEEKGVVLSVTPRRKVHDGFSQTRVVPCTTPHRVTTLEKKRKRRGGDSGVKKKRRRVDDVVGRLSREVRSGEVCALCPDLEVGLSMEEEDSLGPLVGVVGEELRVHRNCGLWVPVVCQSNPDEPDGPLLNVVKALCDKKCVSSCSACDQPMALIPCDVDGCDKMYHFICAMSNGAKAVLDTCKLYCPSHTVYALEEQDMFKDMKFNPWTENDDECYLCKEDGYLLCCDKCPRSIHPTCAGIEVQPEGSYICSDCGSSPDEVSRGSLQPISAKSVSNRTNVALNRSKQVTKKRLKYEKSMHKKTQQVKESGGAQDVLLATGLTDTQLDMFVSFARRRKSQVVEKISGKVTHVVTSASDVNSIPKRTLKYCAAVARGCRVVSFAWVQASYEENNDFLDSQPHELPNSGSFRNFTPLFKDVSFYFDLYSTRNTRTEKIAEIVTQGGGKLLNRIPKNDTMRFFIVESPAQDSRNARKKSVLANERIKSLSSAVTINEDWILDKCSDLNSSNLPLFEQVA